MLLSIRQPEVEALLTHYIRRVRAIVSESVGVSARMFLDRITPVMADLAVDILAREAPVISGVSKTKAKVHLNRAQTAVLDMILPEKVPAGRDADHHGIFENLPLGEAWGLLRLSGHRSRLRKALLARLREETKRMLQECARDVRRC